MYSRKGLGQGGRGLRKIRQKRRRDIRIERAQAKKRRRLNQLAALNYRTSGSLGRELKFVDRVASHTIGNTTEFVAYLSTTPAAANIFGTVQGTAPNNRIGNKILVTQIQCRVQITVEGRVDMAATAGDNMLRFVWVLDQQTNGETAEPDQVFEEYTDITSWRKMSTTSRFRILKDITIIPKQQTLCVGGFNVGNGVTALYAASEGSWYIQWSKKCQIPVKYIGDTTAIASIADNSVSLYVCSQQGATNRSWDFRCLTRIRYYDS